MYVRFKYYLILQSKEVCQRQINAIEAIQLHFLKNNFNIILPYTPISQNFEWQW
jgi:hypothetical protein